MTNEESWREGSVAERNLYMLDAQLMTDCTFVVGITEKKFQCHKYVLSHSSSVFYAMFNGGLQEKGEVKVKDIEPQHFRKILEFIYSDNTELENVETALSVCYAANKYMIYKLIMKCINFIKENLDRDIVIRALEFARLVDNTDLEAHCLQFLKWHASDVLKSDSFPNADRTTLLDILSQDDICVTSEVEVFSACIRWAKAQGGTIGNLRQILGPDVLKRIRILNMTSEEFTTIVIPSKLLELQEERDILFRFLTGTGNMPHGISNSTENRGAFGPRETIELKYNKFYARSGQVLNNRHITFSVNVESVIHGLQLRGLAHGSPETEESFKVNLLLNSEIVASAKFEGLMSSLSTVEVSFNKSCFLQAHTSYTLQFRYSNLNASYNTTHRHQIHYVTNAGVILSANYNFTSISKIYLSKIITNKNVNSSILL